jgi:hypothetical protein
MMFRTPMHTNAGAGEMAVYSGTAYIDRARLMFVGIHLLLGALLARWAYELAGGVAAIVAAALFAFDPNFMGHGALVKNDVPITLLMLLLMFGAWQFGRRASLTSFALIAGACAFGVNVKFSGLVFGPILATVLLLRAFSTEAWPAFGSELRSLRSKLTLVGLTCIAIGFISWAAVWTVYRWRFSISDDPNVQFDRQAIIDQINLNELLATSNRPWVSSDEIRDKKTSFPVRAIFWLDDHKILPDAWLHGLLFTYSASRRRGAFLIGMISNTGWWYYFPLAMLFKTPLAVLIGASIVGVAAISNIARSRAWKRFSWMMVCLWLPIAIYGLSAMRSNLNLGIRHMLPVYPFIYLLLSIGTARLIQVRRRLGIIVVWVLIIGAATETLANWPHEIAFFNVACGGSGGGARLLGDSNIDWGQDLPLLAQWQKDHPHERLYLSYFGSADPGYYGIDYIQVAGGYAFSDQQVQPMDKPGVLAISLTNLQGIYDTSPEQRLEHVYLRQRKPIERLGGSIYLYDWNPAEFEIWRDPHADHR